MKDQKMMLVDTKRETDAKTNSDVHVHVEGRNKRNTHRLLLGA